MYFVQVKVADKKMRFNVNLFRGFASAAKEVESSQAPIVHGTGEPVDYEQWETQQLVETIK